MSVDYFGQFASLKTDKSPSRWTEHTRFRAPHKPMGVNLSCKQCHFSNLAPEAWSRRFCGRPLRH